jgi:NadR type nicotinamide-nucleotide adenylyltransferase
MKVIALIGPESSGKSCLARAIAERFGGLVVDEYVRQYIEEQGRDTFYSDIDPIARGQLAAEDRGRQRRPGLLVLDTHLLSNMLWSQTLFGDCPTWLEPALLARHYDLSLLLSPLGMPWVEDGQRCQPEMAERMGFFARSEEWLKAHGQIYEVLDGAWDTRREAAFGWVKGMI